MYPRKSNISCMCKKQTSVSHSSSESDVISLDAGLRLDGIPALDLWGLEIEVSFTSSNQPSTRRSLCLHEQSGKCSNVKIQKHSNQDDLRLTSVDHVPSNAKLDHFGALHCEAVIKMIIKGQSPTMRHVSRTHKLALNWLFDRINLDTKIQIRYLKTKKISQTRKPSPFVQHHELFKIFL